MMLIMLNNVPPRVKMWYNSRQSSNVDWYVITSTYPLYKRYPISTKTLCFKKSYTSPVGSFSVKCLSPLMKKNHHPPERPSEDPQGEYFVNRLLDPSTVSTSFLM